MRLPIARTKLMKGGDFLQHSSFSKNESRFDEGPDTELLEKSLAVDASDGVQVPTINLSVRERPTYSIFGQTLKVKRNLLNQASQELDD